MRRAILPALSVLMLWAAPLFAAPVLITEPDYIDSFTVVAEPPRTPKALGTVTRDGYPVFPTPWGGVVYIEQHGERIPGPLYLPGFGVPQVVTGPAGGEIPTVEARGGRIGLTEE